MDTEQKRREECSVRGSLFKLQFLPDRQDRGTKSKSAILVGKNRKEHPHTEVQETDLMTTNNIE